MSFYNFHQNNTGGAFIGPGINVVIEADTPYEANTIAQDHGLYFDGCADGRDCSCCGDRWYPVRAHDAEDTIPEPYDFDHYWASDEVPVQHIIRKTAPKEIEQ